MKKTLLIAMLLALCGVQVHAAAVGSRGGKKNGIRRADSSGNPVLFSDDVAWKVFESTQANGVQILDESGVAPKQGVIHMVCLSTNAVTTWAIVYDSNTATGLASGAGQSTYGIALMPPLAASTTLLSCTPVLNALFTSGAVIALNSGIAQGGVYVYWRELGGYR